MNKCGLLCAAAGLLLICSASLWAGTRSDSVLSNYNDARKLAMGGVQGPTAQGSSALFMNPAGIARRNEIKPFVLGGMVYANLDPSVVNEVFVMGNLSVGPGFWMKNISSNADFENGVGGSMSLFAGASLAGIGAAVNFDSELLISKASGEKQSDMLFVSETTFAGGGSYRIPLQIGGLYVGGGVRRIYQAHSSASFTREEVLDLFSMDSASAQIPAELGTGMGFDVGALLDMGLFQVSLNVKNIGGTRLDRQAGTLEEAMSVTRKLMGETSMGEMDISMLIPSMSGSSMDPAWIPMSVVIGAGIDVDLMGITSLVLAGDYEHVFWAEEENREFDTVWKNVHIGSELDILNILQLRVGINQGYLTGGFGISAVQFFHLLDFSVNFSYFTREIGGFAGHRPNEALKAELVISLLPWKGRR